MTSLVANKAWRSAVRNSGEPGLAPVAAALLPASVSTSQPRDQVHWRLAGHLLEGRTELQGNLLDRMAGRKLLGRGHRPGRTDDTVGGLAGKAQEACVDQSMVARTAA